MPAPAIKHSSSQHTMLGASAAALRKVIAYPLKRRKHPEPEQELAFNSCAMHDPVKDVLENEIIPQLMLAHLIDGSLRSASIELQSEAVPIDAEASIGFATLSLRREATGLLEEVDRILSQGVSVEEVYLDLLAPAARHLGKMWETDDCDFVDVTMGLWRLQEVMREISLRSPPRGPSGGFRKSALFCPLPGDVHSFGAQMIEEVFARAGWQSEVFLQPERRELLDVIARKPLDLIGLTITRDCSPCAVASLIKAIRGVSANPHISVLIGGRAVNSSRAFVSEAGADGTAIDACAALDMAQRMVTNARQRALPQ